MYIFLGMEKSLQFLIKFMKMDIHSLLVLILLYKGGTPPMALSSGGQAPCSAGFPH